jgi:head-tail adaptor
MRIPTGQRSAVVWVDVPAPKTAGTRPKAGDYVEAWVPSGGPWFVAIASAGGREHKQAMTSIGQATHTITGPFRADVTIRARLRRESRAFNIVEVEDRDDRHVELICRCQEVIP